MNASSLFTHNLGYPRIGEKRELKTAVEAYWKGSLSAAQLQEAGARLRQIHWQAQKDAGIDLIPSNDFSFYDQVLDLSCLLGNIPERFRWNGDPIGPDLLFQIARGADHGNSCSCPGTAASEMTKWFDTNYHYLVPEFHAETRFRIGTDKPFAEFAEALALGLKTKPVLIGPATYLTLGKVRDEKNPWFDRFSLIDSLLPVYAEILRRLQAQGAEWVQLDEPILATDLTETQKRLLRKSYAFLREEVPGLNILLATYFGDLRDNLSLACGLDIRALHLDAVRAPHEVGPLLRELSHDKILSLGIVDGRNIWKNDFDLSLSLIKKAQAVVGKTHLWLAPSCSLLHTPSSLAHETKMDPELKNWLAFAREKLTEVNTLARHAGGDSQPLALHENQAALQSRRASPRLHRSEVRQRTETVSEQDLRRSSSFPERQALQRQKLGLPLFPTTTIGSFPQTAEVRAARARSKNGNLPEENYTLFLEEEIAKAVRLQEVLDIDMPVHGEFERNDMVEYFGEQLDGFAFTENGWVQSYGSRCVKPPILFGDVARPRPMTVRWSAFAQSLTQRPMKGMLTGPVTILQWSFVRNDQPRAATARQIALALRDEVLDLEKAGLAAIQIDEPALREGLPLREADRPQYLRWAVDAFRLSAGGVRDETQIHTHMCYAEFNDIIGAIADLDADVISIETSRSNMELLEAFVEFRYLQEIGPGVYDIHSPRIPTAEEMAALLEKAAAVLPPENLWVNPDCGLKTRGWKEVIPSLENMVRAAKVLREKYAGVAAAG
jgi:5-methyltetrahydropteroyltriglutamate--homocysteine methyltransferase